MAARTWYGARKPEMVPPPPRNSRRPITAAATRLNLHDADEMRDLGAQSSKMEWQGIAWNHYDSIGEVQFTYNLEASIMSRLRLFPGVVVDPSAPPVDLADGVSIERPEGEDEESTDGHRPRDNVDNGVSPQLALRARQIFDKALATSDIAGMLRSFTLNIQVPGECYLLLYKNEWSVRSTDELKVDSSGIAKLTRSRGSMPKDLPKEDVTVGRIWRQHPRFSYEPSSAMRALAADCEELILLGRVIRSNSRGRLNAGAVYIPDEVIVLSQSATDDEEVMEDEEEIFVEEFTRSIIDPIRDEDSANTVLPLLLRGPAELGDKIKYITFDRKTDEFMVARADRVLERIMQGIDAPKDVVTGLANVKYSNAIHIDENLYKAHIEPLALMFVDALTDIMLRPLLRATGEFDDEEIAKLVVWYDPSEVVTRPDRADDAQQLYDSYELSGASLREARGFSESDKPSEDEIAFRLAVGGIIPPEVMQVLIERALPNVLKKMASSQGAPTTIPDSLAGQLDDSPQLDPTAQPVPAAAGGQ